MKKRLLEILDELKDINIKLTNIAKNRIINNESLSDYNNNDETKKYNIRLEVLKKEFELLVIEYENQLLSNKLKGTVDEFYQLIHKIVENIKEEDGKVS